MNNNYYKNKKLNEKTKNTQTPKIFRVKLIVIEKLTDSLYCKSCLTSILTYLISVVIYFSGKVSVNI